MSREQDRLKPPRAGEPISARYLRQEHRRAQRDAVVVVPPLWSERTEGGLRIGVNLSGFLVAVSTSTITAATRSGTSVTAFGAGTVDLCDGDGSGCEPNPDKEVDVLSLATSSIASGSMVLLAELPTIGKGLFVLGRVC